MTVAVQTPFASFLASGSATFAYAFKVNAAADLIVKINGVTQLSSLYGVTGVGTSAGSVVFISAPTAGAIVSIQRKALLQRTTDYQNNGDFLAGTVNPDFDAVWMALQDQQYQQTMALQLSPADIVGVDTTLPTPVGGAVIGWNATGKALVNFVLQAGTSLVNLAASTGASLVGFIQSGTGAVATDVQSKLRESVSVKDFGATGDGSTPDTAAIIAANAYAKSVNKGLYFPAGTYKYVPTVPIEAMSWIGESAENTAIYVNCASYSGVVFRNTGGRWADLTIRETNLIKTSGILYQLSASTALNAIGGAASFTAYAKSDRLWVFGGQYALDIGNMFTCEFDHCRFNQAGTGVNCTPLLAGGGYANTLNFTSCEIADNNKNCNFNPAGGPALGVTFTNGSIERALVSTSTFANCPGISFRDVYQEQSVAISTIQINGCDAAYAKFVISGLNCDLTVGTNTTVTIEGWHTANKILGGDGTNSIILRDCKAVPVGSSVLGSWLYATLINTSYRGIYYQNAAFNAGHGPFEIVNQTLASAPVASASTIAIIDPVTQVTGTATIQTITPPPVIAANGGWITLIPTGLWNTNNAGNIQLATNAVVYKPLKLYWDAGTSRWYPSY